MHANSLPQLLAGGESETVEFKESLQEEALQAIGAFANHRGGTLLIGVTDAGVPIGLVVGKATVREIIDRSASCTEPRVVPDVQVVTLNKLYFRAVVGTPRCRITAVM
jgi:ATP-dependent DNA helicase RecG